MYQEEKEDQSRADVRKGGAQARGITIVGACVPECALEREGVANQARPITQDQIGGALTNFVNIRYRLVVGFFRLEYLSAAIS